MGYIIEPNSITVTYEEFEGSPQINISEEKISVRQIWKIAWSDMWTFARQVLGWSEVIGPNIVIHEPQPYAPEGMVGYVVAKEIESMIGWPHGAMVESPTNIKKAEYNHCIVSVRYEIPEYLKFDPTQPLISESIEPAAEFITIPTDGLYWDNSQTSPIPEALAPGVIIRMYDWIYTFHKMPYIPTELLDLVGTINQYEMYSRSLSITIPEGCALIGNPSTSREWTGLGTSAWSITVRITVRQVEWNLFPKSEEGDSNGVMQFLPIFDSTGDRFYPYQWADWSSIII